MRDKAIRNTHTNVVSINAETDAWDKDGNVVELDESKVTEEIKRLQAEFDAQAYARTRQQNYPSKDDLIVALWEKVMEGRSESADALEVKRQQVKTAHPKPE